MNGVSAASPPNSNTAPQPVPNVIYGSAMIRRMYRIATAFTFLHELAKVLPSITLH